MMFLKEAWHDTVGLLPFLIIIYFLVSFLEYRYGDRMGLFLAKVGFWGPVAGAFVGCLPQCGFSVVAAALYIRRLISPGTLIAVFLSTSDEAVPVLLSMPGQMNIVGLLIVIKVSIAIVFGMGIDFVLGILKIKSQKYKENDRCAFLAEGAEDHCGCCSHDLAGKQAKIKALFFHPLWHTAKIFAFLFLLTALLNLVIKGIGDEGFVHLFLKGTIFQPMIAAAIGLIPNCFSSVFLSDLFLKGIISFGALVSGLCSAAGLGLLVLAKENKDLNDTLRIVGLLLFCSIISGIILQIF